MRLVPGSVLNVLPLYAHVAMGDRYAANQNAVVVDSPLVAANFPEVDGVKLLSPAFADPNNIAVTFANGTSGPTPQRTLGMFQSRCNELVAEYLDRKVREGSVRAERLVHVQREVGF